MGISIHYSGAIEAERIEPLCVELADIASSVGFAESVLVDDDEKGLRGIILRPVSKMESIPFLFDTYGRMHSLSDLIVVWTPDTAIYSVAVKTQFAECTDHIWLIELLRYIHRKYIPELNVVDEGGYWESNDADELKHRIESLGAMIKGLGSALENAFMDTVLDEDDPDALTKFIEKVAQDFQKRRSDG